MKTIKLILPLLLLLATNCKSDDDAPTNSIDKLPPATQTGEQTFGCLIDGEAFIPDSFGSGRPNAFYQFIDGAYTLGISSSSGGGPTMKSISIGAIDIPGVSESTFSLESQEIGNFHGRYSIGGGIELRAFTDNENPGTLTITNFDEENFIISGTFEFTVLDNDNNEIKITEGRFDVKYTN